MWFTSIAVVAGGTLIGGVKVYQEKKRKRETPWTVYAEKLGKNKFMRSSREKKPSWPAMGGMFVKAKEVFLLSDSRRQQLSEMSEVEQEKSQVEKELNRNLAMALSSMGFAVSGALLYPPLALLSLPGVIVNSRYILSSSYDHLVKQHKVNIDVLNAVIITMFIGTGHYVLANIPFVLTALRRTLVDKVKDDSKGAIIDVFKLQPRLVSVLSDGVEVEIASETLKPDHIVVVHAGETISVDGTIISGTAAIDQHILTGESQPADKGVGESVFALTVVLSGRIYIQIEKTGSETTAAQIGQILNQTVELKTGLQLQAEAMTDSVMLPTLLVSTLSLPIIGVSSAGGVLTAPPRDNMTIAGAIGILNYLNLASKEGILIKDGRTLELLNHVDTVVFDKTGTLTETEPHVGQIDTCDGVEMLELLRYAAAAEYKQTHPIAKAILQCASAHSLTWPKIDSASVIIGYGLRVQVDDKVIHVGSERFMTMEEIPIPSTIREIQADCLVRGYSFVLVAIDRKVAGAIELHPTVRKEAQSIIEGLRKRKKSLVIISGDHEAPTKKLAAKLSIDHYFAETLPENKAKLIEQLQNEGKTVCFIGDGINDAIALKKAHVGISLRGASTVATDSANVILMDESLNQLCRLFDLAQECKKKMNRTYLMIAIPPLFGATGALFFHFGFIYVVLMNQIGFLSGLTNVMLPLLEYRKSIIAESQSHDDSLTKCSL